MTKRWKVGIALVGLVVAGGVLALWAFLQHGFNARD